jgi:hypothetical protein
VRRHKAHDEVAAEVRADWADRLQPQPLLIEASAAENAMFAELANTWIHPASGTAPTSGKGRTLFPWTLFKAALSSHRALGETIAARRATLAKRDMPDVGVNTAAISTEDAALERLGELNAAIDDTSASKLTALIQQLREIGVGPPQQHPGWWCSPSASPRSTGWPPPCPRPSS